MTFPYSTRLSPDFPETYPVLEIQNNYCSGKIALHGAHLMKWQPKEEKPVIYTSPEAVYKEGKAIRGGVPVCWPWFNAHPTDSSLPSHGVARNRMWTLESVRDTAEETIITLTLTDTAQTRAHWNHAFLTTLVIRLGASASLSLTTKNTGLTPLIVGGALHTYFSISDIEAVEVTGLEGSSYIDTVGEEAVKTQLREVLIKGEVDRIYLNTTQDIMLHDPIWKRTLKVSRSGSKSAVLWNPWKEKAKALSDLPNEGYQDFLCIEAANAREDVYTISSGEEHTLHTVFHVTPLL